VARQHRELAIRHAVGAQRGDIFRKVLLDGVKLIGGSMAIGIVIALVLSRLLVTLLFEVAARDPINLLAASALLGLMAILVCFMPACRAACIAPMDALRTE
jgi:putative ABC transport system permease protein